MHLLVWIITFVVVFDDVILGQYGVTYIIAMSKVTRLCISGVRTKTRLIRVSYVYWTVHHFNS